MALTRNFLKGMGLTEEQVGAIIEEHSNTVNGLKAERDSYKAEAEKLPTVQSELDDLKAKGDGGWQAKYDKEHSDFEAYKTAQAEKESFGAKEAAFKGILKQIGVTESLIDLVAKASAEDIKNIELDEKGNVKDSDKLTESLKESNAKYITEEEKGGSGPDNPPGGTGGAPDYENMSIEDYIAARSKQ